MTNKTNRSRRTTDDFVIAVFVAGEMIPASDSGRSVDRQTTRLVKIRVVDESITEQVVSELKRREEVQHFLDGMTPQWVQTHSQKSFSCIVVSWKDTPYLRPSDSTNN